MMLSDKTGRIQETFFEVGKRNCHRENHKAGLSSLNKLFKYDDEQL